MFSTSNSQPGVQELLGVREMLEGVHKMVNSLKIFGLGVCGVLRITGSYRIIQHLFSLLSGMEQLFGGSGSRKVEFQNSGRSKLLLKTD
jgi:hypothetical protein